MPSPSASRPHTLAELREAIASGVVRRRSVKDEIRENLICRLRTGDTLFPGIIGYDETVVPQIVNAVLSRHNFILLGLRGQAKSRILRALTDLLDEFVAVMPGCEIHDDPLAPLCAACRARVRDDGDETPIAWLDRTARYVASFSTYRPSRCSQSIGVRSPSAASRARHAAQIGCSG